MAESQNKVGWLNIESIFTIVTALAVMYSVWAQHEQSMENIQKTNIMLTKYEAQLDMAIANDENVLKIYRENLRAVVASMSKEERALMEQLMAVESSSVSASI